MNFISKKKAKAKRKVIGKDTIAMATKGFEAAKKNAKGVLAWALENPSELALGIIAALMLDIDNDLEEVLENIE